MATQNNLHVPDDLLAALQEMASAEGKTVEQVAEEALRRRLEERSWDELIAYGRERRRAIGFTEEQSADAVHEWRKGQRQ